MIFRPAIGAASPAGGPPTELSWVWGGHGMICQRSSMVGVVRQRRDPRGYPQPVHSNDLPIPSRKYVFHTIGAIFSTGYPQGIVALGELAANTPDGRAGETER